MKFLLCCLAFVFIFTPSLAWASYDYKLDQKISPYGQFESESSAKLTRGFTNAAFGWMEIMKTTARIADEPKGGFWKATCIGLPLGFFRFLGRTVVGVYEMVTFYAPQKPIMSSMEGEVV